MKWEQVRTGCLMAALFGSILVLGKVIAKPYAERPPQPTYSFPKTIPLPGWQFVHSHKSELAHPQAPGFLTSVDDQSIAAQSYRYLRNGKPLNIEMRYFVGNYQSVADILQDSTLTRQPPITRKREGWTTVQSPTGSYILFHQASKLHLSACIPPFNRTTITNGEFIQDQNRPIVLAQQVPPWFLGLSPLRDVRCLWTKLSIPSTRPDQSQVNRDSQEARDLEQAWTEWMQWWGKNYPPRP